MRSWSKVRVLATAWTWLLCTYYLEVSKLHLALWLIFLYKLNPWLFSYQPILYGLYGRAVEWTFVNINLSCWNLGETVRVIRCDYKTMLCVYCLDDAKAATCSCVVVLCFIIDINKQKKTKRSANIGDIYGLGNDC